MITMVDPKTGMGDFSCHLTNVRSQDLLFLGDLMALFSDPKHAQTLADWRAGKLAVGRTAEGKLNLVRITTFEMDRTDFNNN